MPVEQEIPAVEVSPTKSHVMEANNRWQAIINPINENLYTALRAASSVCYRLSLKLVALIFYCRTQTNLEQQRRCISKRSQVLRRD